MFTSFSLLSLLQFLLLLPCYIDLTVIILYDEIRPLAFPENGAPYIPTGSEEKNMKTVIPVLLQPDSEDYFWSRYILEGIHEKSTQYNLEHRYLTPSEVPGRELPENTPFLLVGYSALWLSETADRLKRLGYLPVTVNANLPALSQDKYSGVCFDLKSGMEKLLEHCILAGRHHIALFGASTASAGDIEKTLFFRQLTDKIYIGNSGQSLPLKTFTFPLEDSLEQTTVHFASSFREKEIDAVICANDTAAIFLTDLLLKTGVQIPEELFITGMGNSFLGRFRRPALTSLGFDYTDLGRQAVRLWRYLYRDGQDANMIISLPCTLHIRETTAVTTDNPSSVYFGISDQAASLPANCFYGEEKVERLLRLETLLCQSDSLDLALLQALQSGMSDETIADTVHLSSRGVRYRLSRIMSTLGVSGRHEVTDYLKAFGAEIFF